MNAVSRDAVFCALSGAAAFVLLGFFRGASDLSLTRLAVAGASLLAAAAVDVREHRVPNRIVVPAATFCAILAGAGSLRQSLVPLALTALLLVVALANPTALGMGDIKAALLITLALGSAALPLPALVIGLGLAAAAGGALVLCRGSTALTVALPLAPFLAVGAELAIAVT